MRLLLLPFVLLHVVYAQQKWNARNFPNPTAGQFQQCKMKTTANICDPDGVLTEQARYRLDHDLKMLETRTRQDNARTFCDKKGVTGAMGIVRRIEGGSSEAVEEMANNMLQSWTLDPQCQKAVVIVVAVEDMKFWVARDDKVPVLGQEFTEIFMAQKQLFQQKQYQQALTNILQQTWERTLSKKTPTSGGGGGGRTGGNVGPTPGRGSGSGGVGGGGSSGGSGFKMPSIPTWLIIAIVAIVIPTLCCCLCCYCCCCRGSGGGGAAAAGGGGGGDPQGGGGGGGGGGSMFRNFMSSAGGAGVGSMIGQFFSNRNRGAGMRGGGGGGGSAYPDSQPMYDRGGNNDNGQDGGLYPSVAVKDRGGGGSWA